MTMVFSSDTHVALCRPRMRTRYVMGGLTGGSVNGRQLYALGVWELSFGTVLGAGSVRDATHRENHSNNYCSRGDWRCTFFVVHESWAKCAPTATLTHVVGEIHDPLDRPSGRPLVARRK